MTPREYRILRDLPHAGLLTIGASGKNGPYWARYAPEGGRSVGPCSGRSPFIAAMAAIEKGLGQDA